MAQQWISIDDVVYPIDTDEEIAEAQAAMRAADLKEADVYVGDPDSPDCYKNGRKLFA